MYSSSKLEALADDQQFVAEVREVVQELLASGACTQPRQVWPLLRYGPEHPAGVLRLCHLSALVDLNSLDPQLLAQVSSIVVRVEDAAHE